MTSQSRTYKLANIFVFILCMSGCQTLKDRGTEQKREEELLTTQKTVVINYINQGLPNMALKELRPLIVQNPKDVDFRNLMGLTYLALRNPETALTHFEDAYKLETRPSIALNLSSAYIETKKFDKAIKILKDLKTCQAGKEYAYPERINHNIALAAERINKLAVAEKYYKLALQDNPGYYLSLMRLGQLYESIKKNDLALDQYQKAHESCTRCIDPILAMVNTKRTQGRVDDAKLIIQDYLASKELDNVDRVKAKRLLLSLGNAVNGPILSKKNQRPANSVVN